MEKIDLKKQLKHLYNPPKEFVFIDVPEMNFLMIDGKVTRIHHRNIKTQ